MRGGEAAANAGRRVRFAGPGRRDRRCLTLTGAVVAVSLLVGGCTADRAEVAEEVGIPVEAGGPRAARVAAPLDCATNAYCAPGLASTYGIDITEALSPTPRIADSVDALRAGEVDVAVVLSGGPYADDPGLVVLEDDRSMLGADHVVPLYRASLVEVYGRALVSDLDALSALLTLEALRSLDAAVAAGATPAAAAGEWLATVAPDRAAPDAKVGAELVVGSTDLLESRTLAAVIAGYLGARGYPASVQQVDGQRAGLVDALANGDVAIAPEYAASLLEHLNGNLGEATAALEPTVTRLREYLELFGVAAADPAPARSTNLFVTTVEVAGSRGLRRLSDLAGLGFPEAPVRTRLGPSSEPPELAVLVRAVDHQLAAGSEGPEVRDLQERLRQLGFSVEVTGRYDQATIVALRQFQAQQELAPDGVAGPRTQAALIDPARPRREPHPVAPGDPGTTRAPAATATGEKVLYLTFDDGPHPEYTPQVLDLLDARGAKATFFEIGQAVAAHPELSREVVARGHALGNHTWDHPDMRKLDAVELRNEIEETSTLLEATTGRRVTCMRPPYGASNDAVRAAIAADGLSIQLWDIDPQDWNRPGVDAIVTNVTSGAGAGRISLMHDGGGNRSQTIEALARVLDALSAEGYRFDAIPGC